MAKKESGTTEPSLTLGAVFLFVVFSFAVAAHANVEITGAVSREFSMFVDTSVEITDAVSREFSVFVDTSVEVTDAVSREFDVYVQGTGSFQGDPVQPTLSFSGGFGFRRVVTHSWGDPPSCYGYKYVIISDALFTSIADFPTGFVAPFAVQANGQSLGTFGPGQSASFTDQPGGGVSSFTVMGIKPFRDPGDPMAFPLQIDFNTQTADFDMIPIITADADADTDVDVRDFLSFQACARGPGVALSSGCDLSDFDADGDVDLSDFGIFQRCYSGENVAANSNCAN